MQAFLTLLCHLARPGGKTDLDDELHFHLDQAIEANLARGMDPATAQRSALAAFGGLEKAREEAWRQHPRWLAETVMQDIRYALRDFRRNPGFTATVITTLALAIGATTAVFSVVDPILFRSLPYMEADRLVSLGLIAPIVPEEFMLGGSYYVWRDNQKAFSAFTSESGVDACDLTERNPAHLNCAAVEANFLPTIGVPLALGRNFLPEEDRPNGPKVAILSWSLWQSRYGGDAGVLNRLIDLDGAQTRIIGVLPRSFEMPTREAADVLRPQALDEAQQRKADPGRVLYAFGRLKPGISIAAARASLEPLFQYSLSLAPPGFRKEVHLRVRSVRDRQMEDIQRAAWVLLAAVLAVLLIACANVASLLLARGVAREREMAVRSALGAALSRLVRQTLTESMLQSMAGAVTGWFLAEVLVKVFKAIAPANLPLLDHARLDWRIAASTTALAVACGTAFGLLTALRKPRPLAASLTSRVAGAGTSAWIRRTLVVAQIAISVVLLSASSLLARSFWNLRNQSLGFNTHGVLAVNIDLVQQRYATAAQQMEFFRRIETTLRRLPGVTAVGLSDSLPPSGWHHESILNVMQIEGHPRSTTGTGGMVAWRSITPDYLRVLGLRVIAGRSFTEADRGAGEDQVILSRLLSNRLFAGQDPIGARIRPSPADPYFTVVGVAENAKNGGLAASDEPEYYRLRRNAPDAYNWGRAQDFTLATDLSTAALAPWVRAEVAAVDPGVPLEMVTLEDSVKKLAAEPRFEAVLVAFFAGCGLLMAVIGLYGVVAFVVSSRTQEIGVRMALGATHAAIVRLVAWEGGQLLLIGGALGVAAGIAAMRLLRGLLFGVRPYDPATLLAVTVVMAFAAFAATLIPARRAMLVDPVEALRRE